MNQPEDIQKYKTFIEKEVDTSVVIKDVIEIDNDILVFHDDASYSNPYNDERLERVGGIGPLRINKLTGDKEFLQGIEYTMIYADREELKHLFTTETVTYEKLITDAIARKHINWSDFTDIFEVKGLKPPNISMSGSVNKELLRVTSVMLDNITENEAEIIINFLEDINANFKKEENNRFTVELDIP